jgi:hypothetical protein
MRFALFISLGVLGLATVPSWTQESIVTMCEMTNQGASDDGKICVCALNAVRDQLSSDEFGIYADVGTQYLKNLADGLDRADAWDLAAKTVGNEHELSFVDVLEITNPIGRAHAKAMKDCKS